jgi:hypothetical protein
MKFFLEFSLLKIKIPQKEPPTCENLPPNLKKNIIHEKGVGA